MAKGVILAFGPPKGTEEDGDESSSSVSSAGEASAGRAFAKAVGTGDGDAIAEAFKRLLTICSPESEEE